METRVKICCMASVAEAGTAVLMGASAVGLVSRMPSGPGPIEEELIAAIVATVPRGVETFLLTSETSADAIIAQQRRTGASTPFGVDVCSGVRTDGRLDPEKLRAFFEVVRAVR